MFQNLKTYCFYLFVFLSFLSLKVFSQHGDTLYIYETIHVVDTVWLETPAQRDSIEIPTLDKIELATLLLDTTTRSASLIYFSTDKSATIPINRIIVNENQLKQTKMKKAGFFTLMFLAFQSITYAQNVKGMNTYSIGYQRLQNIFSKSFSTKSKNWFFSINRIA